MDIVLIYGHKKKALQVTKANTVRELHTAARQAFSIPRDQLSMSIVTHKGVKLNLDDPDKPLDDDFFDDLKQGVQVKNLGKQIRWEYVFYIEYLGPILIIPTFYFLGKRSQYTWVHPLAAVMGVTHYLKRQLETAFVHVFSRKTMPFKRVFINSAHYWILFALLNSIELFMFPKASKWKTNDLIILFVIWAFMEFLNFKCHQELSSFRKKGAKGESENKTRGIPRTYGFKFVSCANYLWETLGWVTFSVLTRCYSSYAFTAVSAAQMAEWALKKHKAYKKQFGEKYPKNRKAMIPLIL